MGIFQGEWAREGVEFKNLLETGTRQDKITLLERRVNDDEHGRFSPIFYDLVQISD